MAHVCFLTLVFAPDGVSTSILMSELALELQAQGHQVSVLTTTPHYNVDAEARGRQPLRRRWGGLLYESRYHGIPVYHAAIPQKGERVGARLLDYLRFHLISTLAGLFLLRRVDVLFVPSPPLTIGLSGWILRLFKRAPFVYNVQEIYPDVAVSLGLLKNRRAIRLLERLEAFIYRRASLITVISERFRQRLLAKGVPERKLAVIPNFVDTDFIRPGERQNGFSAAHDLDGRFVVLYAGNIGLTQGFETILAAAGRLEDRPDIHFLIVGDGTRRGWLEEQLAARRPQNVTLLPYQKRSLVPELYAASDLCLVPLKKGTAQETFPSKIYTIMAAARPVIASADPDSELEDVVRTAGCGWAVEPDNPTALAEAIASAAADRAAARARGQSGYRYVIETHSRPAVTAQYARLFHSLNGHAGRDG